MAKANTAYGAWMKTGIDTWMLGAKDGTVMASRMARIATGGAAGAAETELMVIEKVRVVIELQTRLVTGALGFIPLVAMQGTPKHYRSKVAAHNCRLCGRRNDPYASRHNRSGTPLATRTCWLHPADTHRSLGRTRIGNGIDMGGAVASRPDSSAILL